MNDEIKSSGSDSGRDPVALGGYFPVIAAAVLSWAVISLGFLGLKMLMRERPEFVGAPFGNVRGQMVQESPRIVARKANDDVSVIKPMQPEGTDVVFDLKGRRDYRGLGMIMDMSGEFHGRYVLTNASDESAFVLFKCPHPRAGGDAGTNLVASGLRLQSSINGVQENARDAWFWSGTLPAKSGAAVEISYQVASLNSIRYHVGDQDGNPIKQLRIAFHRQDLDSMVFESGDGTKQPTDQSVSWESRDFLAPDFFSGTIVEGRSLFVSLMHLLEIGPLVCLLFLAALMALILARQSLTAVQMLTICAGYALYFPLILYLSTRFSFIVALAISVVVPGALLVNYARWLVGRKLGFAGVPVFLALFWVFPTLAAFAGWNRGLVLLCLGVVTLWVLIDLQNRALRRNVAVIALAGLIAVQQSATPAEIQVLLPAELAGKPPEVKRENVLPLVAFQPADYRVREEANHFRVQARVPFTILRAGETPVPLFAVPVHLSESRIETDATNLAGIVNVTNTLGLFAEQAGAGVLELAYRVPVERREDKRRGQIPLLLVPSGNLRLESSRGALEILSCAVWGKTPSEKETVYEIGVAGEQALVVEWHDQSLNSSPPGGGKPIESVTDLYGIGLTRAQHLTVVNSDGSCTHFAEIEAPRLQADEFRMKLPANARLISVSVNGSEVGSPAVEGQMCSVKLPGREVERAANRLSFRIGYPSLKLGFMGTAELALPEVFQTSGAMEWTVALPTGFETQVIASALQNQRIAPDLGRFGDYGRILKSHALTFLAKDLVPPGLIGLSLKYRQVVPGVYESKAE